MISQSNSQVYQILRHAALKSKPMQALIQPLLVCLNSGHRKEIVDDNHSYVLTDNMNEQQVVAQIHQYMKRSLKEVRKVILKEDIEVEEEDSVEDQNKDEKEDQQEEDNDEEEQDVEDQQYNEEQNGYQQVIEEESKEIYSEEDQGNEEQDYQERQQEGQQEQGQFEQQDDDLEEGQQDVGLYGEKLDQQEMESYENQLNDQGLDPEFERIARIAGVNNKGRNPKDQQEEEQEQVINQNFDQFRQIQMQNQKEPQTNNQQKTELDNKIDQLQNRIHQRKQWTLQGQVKGRQRPVNSLLEQDLQFKSGVKFTHQVTAQINNDLEGLIKQRILDQLYDDRVRYVSSNALREHYGSMQDIHINTEKSKKGLAQLYELEFKNYLGLGENKNDRLKKEIMDQFKELNYKLDCLSNFNFIPKPIVERLSNQKSKMDTIVLQEKVPVTMWNRGEQDGNIHKRGVSRDFHSEKEVDNQAKRLKNKRNARQRKKQLMQKRMNRKIEYGGMTKFEAQAKKKIIKNRNNSTINVKYNKSESFFKSMNEKRSSKPNPNLNKMKM